MRHTSRKPISLAVALAFAAALCLAGWAGAQEQPKPAEKPAAPAKKAAPAKAVTKAKSSPEVLALQGALKKAGESPGPEDGIMGRKTRAALRAFQKKNGLKTTGQADKPTMAKLEPFLSK